MYIFSCLNVAVIKKIFFVDIVCGNSEKSRWENMGPGNRATAAYEWRWQEIDEINIGKRTLAVVIKNFCVL